MEGDTLAIWRGESIYFARFEQAESQGDSFGGRPRFTMRLVDLTTEDDRNLISADESDDFHTSYFEWVLELVLSGRPQSAPVPVA